MKKLGLSNEVYSKIYSSLITGKSLSEALIFASTNPQYDDRLFIELQEHGVYRNCFCHTEQFVYTTCSTYVLQKEERMSKT